MRAFWMNVAGILLGSALASADAIRVHVETSFHVSVHAPVADAMKLFTPEGERPWAGEHWNPEYVYSAGATRDAPGAVFTIRHGPSSAVWIVLRRDEVAREYDYAYFVPNLMVTTIRVSFKPVNAETTAVRITYVRTALSPAGDTHVAAMAEGDQQAGSGWQSAIDQYLAAKTVGAH